MRSLSGPVRIEEFGSFAWRDDRWVFATVTGTPFTNDQFAEWYSCPEGVVTETEACTDTFNWFRSSDLAAGKGLWYFIGTDSHGQRVKGEAVVRHLPELEELKPLGLPTAAQGLQFRRPPLQTKVAEPVARRIYLKLPLQHVRFHWRFMSQEDLLSGKLVLRVRRGDLTNEIVIFENGAIAPGWEPISPDGR